ncbi:DUF5977 domain-containing protein [Dyadobacter sp. CY343]|uniref:DUF5977 domain-containing protein n=1 Tax=Dyadobacter sp. CY343 TaxID=2907299 RepID=UPI001F46544E|nr:DUF5977 domain-containing protein [Dyadobacter sp. CY343]MCE7061252.1 DUF5977 domain-containing protein [Dyadobacter sp. CY343]
MIDATASDLSYLPLKFSRNKLTHIIEAADTALTSRVGLKYYLGLSIPEFPFSDNFEELHTSEGRERPVDNQSGIQVFAGAEFRYNSGRNGKIDGLLSYTKPKQKQDHLSVSLSQTMAFQLTEMVKGGEPAVETINPLPKMYAIKAGLSNEDFFAYGENFWKKWQTGKRQFLTWQPNNKRVDTGQEEYLYFLVNFTPKPTELHLRVQYYLESGQSSEAITVKTMANPPLYSVICCPVGIDILGIPAECIQYDVWLSNEDNERVSEVRSFLMDHINEVFDRSILFVNSLGGWDTLRLTGQMQRMLKVAQSAAEIERPADAPVDFSELKIITIQGEYEFQISTGYFKRDAISYLKYLDELLLSDEMYLITDKGHRPLQLITSNLVDQADNQDLIARTFSFRILDTVENYSDLPAAERAAERETSWRGLSVRQVLDSFGKRTGYLAFEKLEKVYADDNSLFKPYTVKSNSQGDPDYIEPIWDSTIIVGSTPFPNKAISRLGSFKRSNCTPGYVGGQATIAVPAGAYGGENAGDADALAEARFDSLDTQAYAQSNGTCTLNNVPVHFAILHKIPMGVGNVVVGSSDAGPVVDLRISAVELISNTIGQNPPETRISDNSYNPGTYNFIVQVEYSNPQIRKCKITIPSKNREIIVNKAGYYAFDNVVVNSSDEPLTFEVTNL